MYNKLFTKILDSTIWLENDATRLVWITFLAVMDEDGFVALSAIGNVAARARVSLEAAESSIKALESPDSADATQEHEGRRIERVPYGWIVLNATKYRDLIKRETQKEQTRLRVAKHRAKSNAIVTQANEKLTPSEAYTEAIKTTPKRKSNGVGYFDAFWQIYPRKVGKGAAEKALAHISPTPELMASILKAVADQRTCAQWTKDDGQFIPHPATWLNRKGWEDEPNAGIDYGRCHYCADKAIGMKNDLSHCGKGQHMDFAKAGSR